MAFNGTPARRPPAELEIQISVHGERDRQGVLSHFGMVSDRACLRQQNNRHSPASTRHKLLLMRKAIVIAALAIVGCCCVVYGQPSNQVYTSSLYGVRLSFPSLYVFVEGVPRATVRQLASRISRERCFSEPYKSQTAFTVQQTLKVAPSWHP
jgi:hypothetical protein